MQRFYHPTHTVNAQPAVVEVGEWFPGKVAPSAFKASPAWGWALVLGSAAGIPAVAFNMIGPNFSIGGATAIVLASFALIVLSAIQWCRTTRRPELDETKEFIDNGDGVTAALTIVQDDVTTGLDYGVVWTEQGALFFSGNRCSFAIPASNLYEPPPPIAPSKHPSTAGIVVDRIGVIHPSRTIRLDFRPLSARSRPDGTLRYNVSWRARFPVTAQYPPLAVQPGLGLTRTTTFVGPLAFALPFIGFLIFEAFRPVGQFEPGAGFFPWLMAAIFFPVLMGPIAQDIKRAKTFKRLSSEAP